MNFEYNVKQIEEILHSFYTVTKIKTVIYNSDFSVITAVPYNECAFCSALSHNPDSNEKCRKCTMDGLNLCRQKNSLIVYKCHAGLIEAVAPIRSNDIIVGYIMLGQVLKDGSNRKEIIDYASSYIGIKSEKFFDELTVKSEEEILAAAKIMESCVCYLLMNKFIYEENGNLLLKICNYIEENPTADLSAAAICRYFKINRNYLYKISNTYLGMPIAAFVRNKRLRYAQTLIKDGCSVTEAAEKAGFNDYGYFGKIYKAYFNKTPGQSRPK